MFEDFEKRKFNEYIKLIEFSSDKTTFQIIRSSGLPPYIINFFDCFIQKKQVPISRQEAEDILHKSIVFNINYVIKPKSTLLKFLFGEVETRPADYINERLRYFQFYSYYTDHIIEFIAINSLYVVSVNQIEHLINEVNKKILTEVISVRGETNRFNLIKLLYYFFLDLGPNNPINIKLPKKILSVFFQDKEFAEIKSRIDGFFTDDIFIQEAIELIKHVEKKQVIKDDKEEQERLKVFFETAKTNLLNKDSSEKDIRKTVRQDEDIKQDTNVSELKSENELQFTDELKDKKLEFEEKIYSNDLEFAARLQDAVPPVEKTKEETDDIKTDEVFCEESYKKKIVKKIFNKDEADFKKTTAKILNSPDWESATYLIEELFVQNKVNFYSEEAVKFVDIIENYFTKKNLSGNKDSAAN
ncbi:MAG: hypothetical protein EHM58_05550 [Ignavibacteriae bacterium]|nr:MAG: hypothetical protein EHM58_05550 [Ignavibacteriota bacterium]